MYAYATFPPLWNASLPLRQAAVRLLKCAGPFNTHAPHDWCILLEGPPFIQLCGWTYFYGPIVIVGHRRIHSLFGGRTLNLHYRIKYQTAHFRIEALWLGTDSDLTNKIPWGADLVWNKLTGQFVAISGCCCHYHARRNHTCFLHPTPWFFLQAIQKVSRVLAQHSPRARACRAVP